MRTGHSLAVFGGVYLVLVDVPGLGGVYLVPGGVHALGGCTCSWGGTWSWGWGGVPGLGWCTYPAGCSWSWGVYLLLGGVSQLVLRQTPPLLTESQTPVKTLPWPNFVAAGNDNKK